MNRLILVLESAFVLMMCATGAAFAHLWKRGPLTVDVAGAAMIVPAVTTVLYLCISAAVPELYAVGRMGFPVVFTLPIVYSSTLLLTMTLLSRVGVSITRVPDSLAAMTVWSSPWLLSLTCFAGILCLWAVGALASERQER